GANETQDTFDGTAGTAADQVFRAVDRATAAPSAGTFVDLWTASGYDGGPLARLYIAPGPCAGGSDEPNDSPAEARQLGGGGGQRTALVLNRFNEDWYRFTLPAVTDALFVDVDFKRTQINADVAVQVQSADGQVVGSASTAPGFSPVRCATGALAAGTYR